MGRWWFIALWPAAAGAAEEGGAAHLNPWNVVNFVVLVAALAVLLRKPLREMFLGKKAQVRQAVDEAEELRIKVEEMVAEYGGRLARLDEEIAGILKDARNEGEREKAEILERARKMAERIEADAKLAAEKERLRVLRELEAQTLAAALRRAEELLKKQVTEREHRMFTDELIETLEKTRGARP